MVFFFYLVFIMFSHSYQTIQAVFFCDDFLKALYKGEGDEEIQLSGELSGFSSTPHIFNDLDAGPGDLIRMKCYNNGGDAFGVGCFVLNNNCFCDNFKIDKPRINVNPKTRSYNFGNIACSIQNIYILEENDKKINYEYYYYIPLDVSKIFCNNNIEVLTVPYGENYYLKLSDKLISEFNKNYVDVSIKENYNYFT